MADMKAYLAAKYMSGAKADAILARSSDGKPKKKKRRTVESPYSGRPVVTGDGTGLGIVDEDGLGIGAVQDEDDEENVPVITEERKIYTKSKANWSTLNSQSALPLAGDSASPSRRSTSPSVKREEDGNAPDPAPKKRKGGLMTAADIAAEQAALASAREAAERARAAEAGEDERAESSAAAARREQETVYRSAAGQKIDVKAELAERARMAAEEARKEAERAEWGKGLVQRREREERAKREREAATQGVARYADDAQMNRELREVEREDDPAAAFLTKKRKKGPQKPKYTGPWPPNRFNIPPGYRWDGVDRSTGFESKMFQRQNDARRRELERNAWSMEDM